MKDTVTLKRGIFKILYRVFLALSFNIEGQFFLLLDRCNQKLRLSYHIFSFLLHAHHGRRREGVPGGVHQEFHEHSFWPCDTTFQSGFWIEIDWKRVYLPQGHVGLPGGCREGVPGGVY